MNRQHAAAYAVVSVIVAVAVLMIVGSSLGLLSADGPAGDSELISASPADALLASDASAALVAQIAAAQEQAAREIEAQRAAAQEAIAEEIALLRAEAFAELEQQVGAQRDAAQRLLDEQIAAERVAAIAQLEAELSSFTRSAAVQQATVAAIGDPNSEAYRKYVEKLAECDRRSNPDERAKCKREALKKLSEYDDDDHDDHDDDD